MTAHAYLRSLLDQQYLGEEEKDLLRDLRDRIERQVRTLQGIQRLFHGGSYGKNTMIRECYDLDIVVCWASDCAFSQKEIFDELGSVLRKHWPRAHPKTVGWEIPVHSRFHIDVIPCRAVDESFRQVSLYRTDTGALLETSVKMHLEAIANSGRVEVMRLMRLWRQRKNVPFRKSLALEMATIEGCRGCRTSDLGDQIWLALEYLRDKFCGAQIMDPANAGNVISDDVPPNDKAAIQEIAACTLQAKTMQDVF